MQKKGQNVSPAAAAGKEAHKRLIMWLMWSIVSLCVFECVCLRYLQVRWLWKREGYQCQTTGRWLQMRIESGSRCLESLRTARYIKATVSSQNAWCSGHNWICWRHFLQYFTPDCFNINEGKPSLKYKNWFKFYTFPYFLLNQSGYILTQVVIKINTNTPPAGPLAAYGDRHLIHCSISHPPPQEAQRNSGK